MEGLTDKEVALRLNLSLPTVRTHWHRLKVKIGVSTRAEAIAVSSGREADQRLEAQKAENQALFDEINKRRRVEKLLVESQQRFKHVCQNLTNGLLIVDVAGRCTYANPKFCEMTGLNQDLLFGAQWKKALMSRICSDSLAQLEKRVKGSSKFDLDPLELKPSEGASLYVRIATSRITTDGEPIGTVMVFEDQTEAHELQSLVARNRRIGMAISAATRDMVYIFDLGTRRMLYYNPVAERFFGISAERMIAMNAEEAQALVHPDDIPSVKCAQETYPGLLDGEAAELSYRALRHDGVWIQVTTRSAVIERNSDGSPRHMLGVSWPCEGQP